MEDNYSTPHLPMDIMFKIVAHISDPASLARLTYSCKFWHNLINDSISLIALLASPDPSFLHKKKKSSLDLLKNHIDKTHCLEPSFVWKSEFSRFVGSKFDRNVIKPPSLETFVLGLGASLNFYKPIASEDNFLVLWALEALTVSNILTSKTFKIPTLEYMSHNHYALFVTNDVGIYGRFISVCYNSNTRTWTTSQVIPELRPSLCLVSSPGFVIARKKMSLTHVGTLHIGIWSCHTALGNDASNRVLSEIFDIRRSLPQRVVTLGISAKFILEMFGGKSKRWCYRLMGMASFYSFRVIGRRV
ncbi:hypothetical protein ZWY2020_018666 [Hordeum vulgare]|nr:hypothetical protein ZWY2020_018666 [Hordeum vulgare]